MKFAAWVFAMTAALLCLPVVADDHVALIKNVDGKVSIVRDSGSLEAKAGTTLFVSDRLVSDAGATAGIVFKDGTLLTLGPRAELLVRDYVFDASVPWFENIEFLKHVRQRNRLQLGPSTIAGAIEASRR